MQKKECFASLQPCDRQSEQNDTDEPPSLFMPINAGTGLNRLLDTPFCPALIAQDLPVFFLSKNRLSQTPINGTLFSTPLRGRKTQEIISNLLKSKTFPFPANGCIRELSASADDCFEPKGFIISRRSKITVTLKCRDRHKEP